MVTIQYYYNIEERWIEVEVNEDVADYLLASGKKNKSVVSKDEVRNVNVDGELIKDETPSASEKQEHHEARERKALQKEILHIALRVITPRQRKVIACKFFDISFRNQFGKPDEKPNQTIAKELGVSRAAVSKVLLAAYEDLRDFFKSVRGGYALYEEYWGEKYVLDTGDCVD